MDPLRLIGKWLTNHKIKDNIELPEFFKITEN